MRVQISDRQIRDIRPLIGAQFPDIQFHNKLSSTVLADSADTNCQLARNALGAPARTIDASPPFAGKLGTLDTD